MSITDIIEAECKQAARATVRRFPSLSYDDAYQQAWVVCLEVQPRLDASRPPGPYFGRALALQLPRYARQCANAAKYPKGREYEHKIPAVTPVGVTHPDHGGLDLSDDCAADESVPAAEAIEIISTILAPERLAPVRAVLLDGADLDDTAEQAGIPAGVLRGMVACSRLRILDDPRIIELADRHPGSEVMRKIRSVAGVRA